MNSIKIKNISLLLFSLVLLQMGWLVSGCSGSKGKEAPDKTFRLNDTMMKLISTDTARIKEVYGFVTLNGEINANADKVVKVFPMVSGNVDEVSAELGDFVHQGQVLAHLASSEAAGYSSDKANADADLKSAQKNFDASQEMYNDGLLSIKDFTQAQGDLNKAKANYQKVTQIMSIYPVTGGSDYVVKAPCDGYIIEKKIAKGMHVRPDNTDNLFTISDLNDVWDMVNIYESDISKIKEGDSAIITTLSYPDSIFHGKIDKIYNVLDPDTKVLKARVVLKNSKDLLKPEMYTQVVVDFSENRKMVAVPSSAVIFDHSKNYIVLFHDRNHLEWREVNVYGSKGKVTYILEGIKPGEVLITKNASLVFNAINS